MNDIDSPLQDLADDTLGRSAYARRVRDVIANWRGDHSLVLAIYGEWGSGKTSFKNFVLRTLEELPEAKQPIVIEFKPWEWTGPREVSEAFFAVLGEGIGSSKAQNSEDASRRLGRYASYFALGASVADSAATLLPFILPGSGVLGTLLSKALRESGEQARTGANAPAEKESFSATRRGLLTAVRDLGRTLVVTIDDVDRLTPAETAMLFQLLKSNADFPHVVYLILCDREVVVTNLGELVAGRGSAYLEKIVQLGLPLPKAYPEQLRASVLRKIISVVEESGVERFLDQTRLMNVDDQYAGHFFRTMRDVNRFLANIETLLPAFVRDDDSDVDLVDFIGIELLRTFDYSFYESLYKHRERLTGREGLPSKDKEFVAVLRGERNEESPTIGLFFDLFPRYGSQRSLRARTRGVAHPRGFDRYFAFAIPPDQYSPTEEDDILARRAHTSFGKELWTARERGRLQYLLELLGGTPPPDDFETLTSYLGVLGDFADSLHIGDGADDVDSFRGQVERLIYSALRPLNIEERADVLVAACEKSRALWFPVAFERHFRRKEPTQITANGLQALRRLAEERVRGSRDRLRSHPALGELLSWFFENVSAEEARQYAMELLKDDRSVLDLIFAFSQPSIANVGKARKLKSGYHIFLDEITPFIPTPLLLNRVDQIDESTLLWRERELLRAFREEVDRNATNDPPGQVTDAPRA